MPHSQHEALKKRIALFPLHTGVYIMKNANAAVIYVGKAKQLRKRVQSYFNPRISSKVFVLMKHVESIECMVTNTEREALLLEHNLIKSHKPKYNVLLKDDKSFPLIRVTAEEYPRVFKTRTLIRDGSTYYGPYLHIHLMEKYLQFIEKHYPLRRCRRIKKRTHPCLYFHLGRCAAVCAGLSSLQEYTQRIQEVHRLLQGKTKEIKKQCTLRMHEKAKILAFEEAQKYRDILHAIEEIEQKQRVIKHGKEESYFVEYAAYKVDNDMGCITTVMLQNGKVIDSTCVYVHVFDMAQDPLEQFFLSYYEKQSLVPKKLFISTHISKELENILRNQYDIEVCIPQSMHEVQTMRFALENAQQFVRYKREELGNMHAVRMLQNALSLVNVPIRIEGFDIATLAGKHTVAAMVCFINGVAKPSEYRHFNIKTLAEGHVDDYAALQETVARRYTRLKNEKKILPNLILVDGGQGQVNSVQEILNALEISVPVIGLAKKYETIFFPTNSSQNLRNSTQPLQLARHEPASRLLQAVRNEAHRFATSFRAKKQKKNTELTLYMSVSGIGKVRAEKLATLFLSPEDLVAASPQLICESISVLPEIAKNLQTSVLRAIEKHADST